MAAPNNTNGNFTAHLVAGAVSGLVNCICLQPLDLLKTRMQQQLMLTAAKTASHPSTMLSVAREVVASQGLSGLWKGTLPTIIRNTPGSSMYFATLSFTRQVLAAAMNISPTSRRQDSHSALPALPAQLNLVAGGFSRVTVGFLMMPISVVKVRYESNLYEYRSIWHALTSIVQRDGYRGLFYGYGSTALRDAPFAGLYVLFYEHCKQLLLAADFPSPLINTSSAVVAGSVATAITHPFDVIRTQIQLKPRLYPNTLTAVRMLYAEAGWRAYLVGMVPRLTRKTLSAAITWTLFEELVKALQ